MNLKSHGLPSELEAFVNSLIAVASKKPINLRESPSVTTLITKEEISKSGARDLIDVLRLVPGIDFGVDIEGVVGIGMRGNWANEGKVLVLLDGQEMNEIISAGNMFGNHYPIEQIKKIEVKYTILKFEKFLNALLKYRRFFPVEIHDPTIRTVPISDFLINFEKSL